MGSVVPLKKSANSAYLDLKNLLNGKIEAVEKIISFKLQSDVNLIKKNGRLSFKLWRQKT